MYTYTLLPGTSSRSTWGTTLNITTHIRVVIIVLVVEQQQHSDIKQTQRDTKQKVQNTARKHD